MSLHMISKVLQSCWSVTIVCSPHVLPVLFVRANSGKRQRCKFVRGDQTWWKQMQQVKTSDTKPITNKKRFRAGLNGFTKSICFGKDINSDFDQTCGLIVLLVPPSRKAVLFQGISTDLLLHHSGRDGASIRSLGSSRGLKSLHVCPYIDSVRP